MVCVVQHGCGRGGDGGVLVGCDPADLLGVRLAAPLDDHVEGEPTQPWQIWGRYKVHDRHLRCRDGEDCGDVLPEGGNECHVGLVYRVGEFEP